MATLAAGSRQPGGISYLDAGGERGAVTGLWGPILTAANIVAQSSAWGNVLSAADDLMLGARIEDRYDDQTIYAVARPTNGAAREIALQIVCRGVTSGQIFRINFPTLNIGLITYVNNIGAKDAVDITTTEVAALITALTAFPIKNPDNYTETTGVVGARVVRGLK